MVKENSISLDNFTLHDAEKTFLWLQDNSLRELFAMQDKPNWERHLNYFKKTLNDPTQSVYKINYNKEHIGNCGFKYITALSGELWIYIGEQKHRGKGLGFLACKELVEIGFSKFNFERIFLHVLKKNLPAIKMYKKLKFEETFENEFDKSIWKERINDNFKMELVNDKKVAMMQPSFLPWQGLFELIYKSDKFIFLDDFQFSVQSHHTRNKLFINKNKVDYYNVPVQKSKFFEANLNIVKPVENKQWKNKLLRTLEYNYKKAPYFESIQPELIETINKNYSNLAELNIGIIELFCKFMNIKSELLKSSDFTQITQSNSKRSKRVEELIQWSGCKTYLSAFGSYDYMSEDKFNFKEYPSLFQNYNPKPYKQIHSETFVPYLSILDALYNIGPNETFNLIKVGTEKWLTPNERASIN